MGEEVFREKSKILERHFSKYEYANSICGNDSDSRESEISDKGCTRHSNVILHITFFCKGARATPVHTASAVGMFYEISSWSSKW